jgi:hypothetical protein
MNYTIINLSPLLKGNNIDKRSSGDHWPTSLSSVIGNLLMLLGPVVLDDSSDDRLLISYSQLGLKVKVPPMFAQCCSQLINC